MARKIHPFNSPLLLAKTEKSNSYSYKKAIPLKRNQRKKCKSYNTAYAVRAFAKPSPNLHGGRLRHIVPPCKFAYAGTLYAMLHFRKSESFLAKELSKNMGSHSIQHGLAGSRAK